MAKDRAAFMGPRLRRLRREMGLTQAVMAEGFPERMARDEKTAIQVMYESDRLGQKNGKGFYRYEEDKKGKPRKVSDEQARALAGEVAVRLQTQGGTYFLFEVDADVESYVRASGSDLPVAPAGVQPPAIQSDTWRE